MTQEFTCLLNDVFPLPFKATNSRRQSLLKHLKITYYFHARTTRSFFLLCSKESSKGIQQWRYRREEAKGLEELVFPNSSDPCVIFSKPFLRPYPPPPLPPPPPTAIPHPLFFVQVIQIHRLLCDFIMLGFKYLLVPNFSLLKCRHSHEAT